MDRHCVAITKSGKTKQWQKCFLSLYTVFKKNDTDVAHYNFNTHLPISVIFGTEMLLSEYAIKW